MQLYNKIILEGNKWVITYKGHDYLNPKKAVTFAFDTETQVYFKNKILQPKQLFIKIKNLNNEEKRKNLKNITWAWQIYDEVNGFFMTNDFYEFLLYQARAGLKFGWCYNSTFDFAQIDYEILAKGRDLWKKHEHEEKGKGYNKGQAWTYESLHNDMGARYAYKLWVEYKNKDRHKYVHAVEYRDFMKLVTGGLERLLNDLDVKDHEGQPIRKLKMNYQNVNANDLTTEEIAYCENDVKGLFYAIKLFNKEIEKQSNNELHIYGKNTNVMTAGGFAKHELLRSLYPTITKRKKRLELYQKQHPITAKQDQYIRKNHLYRGGISYVNPLYKGKLLTRKMYRYDVNSEYPYSMANINDLIGTPLKMTFEEYDKIANKDDYEVIYILEGISGHVKPNMLGFWYDPFKREFVDDIDEDGTHLIFKREFDEMLKWYDDIEININKVLLCKKGAKVYAPYVYKNYELKAEAKKQGNKTLQQVAKLNLNASYGKLAERIERTKGHYELNEETGAIHFIREEAEIEEKSAMNVLNGALVTAYARVYILSKIREICKNVQRDFIYIDTDSIHCFNNYDKADPYTLGGLKLEAICDACKYILPKTYVDIEKVNKDGTIEFNGLEIHSKGVNVNAVINELKKKQKGKKNGRATLELIDNKISYGVKYICLVAMNVQGGKVLLPTEKYLARLEQAPKNDDKIVYTNYEGGLFSEI